MGREQPQEGSQDNTAQARLVAPAESVASCRRGVLILSCGFFGVFGGFQAAQGLQTSLNATLGFINLAALYFTFTVLCLVAPPLVASLDAAVGLRTVLFVSSLAYVAMVTSNVSEGRWVLSISMNVLVGAAAPLLWTSQNDYVGRCAYHSSRSEGQSLATMTATLNGVFFSIYQFAGMTGNVGASVLMMALGDSAEMKDVLFLVLGGVSAAGAVTLLFVPPVGHANSAAPSASLRDTLSLALGDARMALLIPLIFTNGMTLSFIVGDFPARVVCPVAGPAFAPFVTATFYGVNTLATATWGWLISRGRLSRRSVYVAATLCIVAFLLLVLLWHAPTSFVKKANDWRQVRERDPSSLVLVFALAALFAAGDAFFESGPVATLQNYFLGSNSVVPAMANVKMWQSLGYTAQFILGTQLSLVVSAGLLAGLSLASVFFVLALDRRASVQ